jgi:hypothetical protein
VNVNLINHFTVKSSVKRICYPFPQVAKYVSGKVLYYVIGFSLALTTEMYDIYLTSPFSAKQ